MPGFREFSVELRRRDLAYEEVTVNHIGLYAVDASESFFGTDLKNRVVERDSIDQKLSDFQAQNLILSENYDEGMVAIIPTDSNGNSKVNIGHYSNAGGKSIANFSFGNGTDEEYNMRLVNNSDHELVLDSSTDSLSTNFNIDSNVRIRTGNLRIEGSESTDNGVNLEFNWGDGDDAKWLIDLSSNISGGDNQLRVSTLDNTYISLKENGTVLIGEGTDEIDSNNYDLQVYDNFYTHGDTTVNGELYVNLDTELNGNLLVGLNTDLSGSLFVGLESIFTGDITASSDLLVNGNVYTNSNVEISGNLDVHSESSFIGNISAGSDLFVGGKTTLQSLELSNKTLVETIVNSISGVAEPELALPTVHAIIEYIDYRLSLLP